MTKLNWGLIGGGEGSQIGPAHRIAAGLDGEFALVAGALDHRTEAGRDFGRRLGIAADRAYGDWREMLAGETARATAPTPTSDLVTVATPNATHFEITRAFLAAGINVLCEKPMTITVAEGEEIVAAGAIDGHHLRGQLRLQRLRTGAPHAGDGGARRPRQGPAGGRRVRPRPSRRRN